MSLKKIVIGLIFSLWPLSLFLANTPENFLRYLFPGILLLVGYLLYQRHNRFYLLPIIAIPLFEPKLTLMPFVFIVINFVFEKNIKNFLITLLLATAVTVFTWNLFKGQTIFTPDYEAKQEIIRKTQLYNSIFLARTFHNKIRIVFDKFTYNFFSLTDPGNYFFNFHPREIVGNQNLPKYPFLAIIFLFYGLYTIKELKNHKFVVPALVSCILSLGALTIFDRNDFLLWVPLSLILLNGIDNFEKRFSYSKWIYVLILIFSIPEFVRLILLK